MREMGYERRMFYMRGDTQVVAELDGTVHEADPNDPELIALGERIDAYIAEDVAEEREAARPFIEAVLALVEDHHPQVGSWIDDSTWLECSCGWDETKPKAAGWHEHLVKAVYEGLDS